MVRLFDGDTDIFDIVAGVLQGGIFAPSIFIICPDYLQRTSIDLIKENGFRFKKTRSKRCPTESMTDIDYVDDLALLANTPVQSWIAAA